jgi:hypothetical protein
MKQTYKLLLLLGVILLANTVVKGEPLPEEDQDFSLDEMDTEVDQNVEGGDGENWGED